MRKIVQFILNRSIAISCFTMIIIALACNQQSESSILLPQKIQPREPTIEGITKMDTFCRYYIQPNDYINVEITIHGSGNADSRIFFDAPCGMYNIGDTLKIMKY